MNSNFEHNIKNNLMNKLPEMLALHGVSGNEEEVRDYVIKELRPLVDSVTTDTLGNVIAYKKGNGHRKIMTAAHMDEIGLIVKYIDKRGFLFFETIGGIKSQNLYARTCEIQTPSGKVPGIINSVRPGRPYADEVIPESKDFIIDVGANNREDIQDMGVEVGQPVKFIYPFTFLHDKVAGTALDNRLLMFILIEAMREMTNENKEDIPDIYAVFTVQEEVGSRGAKTAAHQISPDIALALDITMANDLPKNHESEYIAEIDKGPAIKVMDLIKRAMLGLIVSKDIIHQLKSIARQHEIPFQLEVQSAGSTDGATIHLEGDGIPTGGICLPTRYVHAYELASVNDIVLTTKFLYESLKVLK